MSKYNYDKKILKQLSVKPFLGEVKTREAEIAKATPDDIITDYNVNKLANDFHPGHIVGYIKKIILENDETKTFIIVPKDSAGFNTLPYFRAGQYISVGLRIGASFVSRPYTLSSNPALALGETNNEYHITIKKTKDGFVSNYLFDKAFESMEIVFSAPLGEFYYNKIRDCKDVIAVAGGSGITPFLSMAYAISTGIEDFNLTIIYGVNRVKDILFKDIFDDLENISKGKIKVVYVVNDNVIDTDNDTQDLLIMETSETSISVDKQGNISRVDIKTNEATLEELYDNNNSIVCEKGLITAEIISKYAKSKDYSLFICGPSGLYNHMTTEIEKLNIPKRRVRFEVPGEFKDPSKDSNYPLKEVKEFKLKLLIHGETTEIPCQSNESLINAIERAGIFVTTDCRSGECGWCHSRLISGDIFIPTGRDNRKAGDKKFGWIHPCITYPLSDIEMEVFPNM